MRQITKNHGVDSRLNQKGEIEYVIKERQHPPWTLFFPVWTVYKRAPHHDSPELELVFETQKEAIKEILRHFSHEPPALSYPTVAEEIKCETG